MSARDYGGPRARGVKAAVWAAVGLAVLVVAALLGTNFVYARQKAVAKAAEWRVDGAPCPTLDRAAYEAQPYRARQIFTYDDFQIGRFAGHVTCDTVNEKGGMSLSKYVQCQFTSPAVLVVTTPRGETIYNPGAGKAATVMVRKGEPRCLLDSNFQLQN